MIYTNKPEAPEWPQPGDKAELHNDPGYAVAYGDSAIGEEVEVLAVFYSDAIKMAAVEHDGSCYCFRADMLRPVLDDKPSDPEPPEWDGKGLPPVGCECEARNYHHGQAFESARVVHLTRKGVILVEYASGDAGFLTAPADFRPIRSEEDRLIEEAMSLIGVEPDEHGAESVVFRMIRAGYRKTRGE